jgi:3-oxoacyl-[acyl-carrier protein] reductase
MNLTGRIALVTGGSRSIGRAISLRLAKEGALVALNYQRNSAAAETVVREIEAAGGEAIAVQGDVGSVAEIRKCFQSLDAELTRRRGSNQFDILVNNAGIFAAGTVEATSEEDYDRTFAVDLKGPFFVTQQAIPRLRQGGRIINISSGLSRQPSSQNAVYCMAKAAINTFTVVLAAELGKRGITVNTLSPGLTASDMTASLVQDPATVESFSSRTALGRIGEPGDIAAVAAFLASADAGWVTGQYIEASGGLGLM